MIHFFHNSYRMISYMKTWHWFQWVSHGVLLFFLGIMGIVTYISFKRTSGSTGMDMADIQQIRHHDVVTQSQSQSPQ